MIYIAERCLTAAGCPSDLGAYKIVLISRPQPSFMLVADLLSLLVFNCSSKTKLCGGLEIS